MPIFGKDKPNFVMVVSDSHPISTLGAYNGYLSKINSTRNLDRIALKGSLFTNSFCTNAVSGPSSAVLLSGKHSHIIGFNQSVSSWKNSQNSLPQTLQQIGYETILFGRWELGEKPKYFDYWKILNNNSEKYNPEFISLLDKKRIEGHSSDIITDLAIQWLAKRKKKEPFFLLIQYNATSMPWIPAIRHLNLYDDVLLPQPFNLEDQHLNKASPSRYQSMDIMNDLNFSKDLFFEFEQIDENITKRIIQSESLNNLEGMTPEQKSAWTLSWRPKNEALLREFQTTENILQFKFQRFVKNYLRCLHGVDENIERLESELSDKNYGNVFFIYTSNKGRMLGEHGWYGSCWMYDESMRVPLIINPILRSNSAKKIPQLVQNLDLTPTILDYAGFKKFEGIQGNSLKQLLQDSDSNFSWRDSVYYHYNEFPGNEMVAKHYGIRTLKNKIIHFYQFDEWEFYDLINDPSETKNIYHDEAHQDTIGKIKKLLTEERRFYLDQTNISIMPDEWRKKYRGPGARKD